jgi:glycyl-tRNA synthetase beta chain
MTKLVELLFEIGTEELPGGFIDPALSSMAELLPKALADARIDCADVVVDGTPRRLVVMGKVAEQQRDLEEELLGPAWSVAFDAEGKPTQAGMGFLNKNGLDVSAVYQKESKKGPVLAAKKHEAGKMTAEVLPALLEALIPKINMKKTMRWGDRHVTNGQVFGRPVQWILALLDGKALSLRFADVVSGDTTRGHRYHAPAPVKVGSVAAYKSALVKGHVMLSRAERAAHIVAEGQRLAAAESGLFVDDPALVELVKNLVEYPHPLLGRFESRFLEVPKELLTSEAREHQKYFMVGDGKGGLLPCFVVVAGADAKDKVALAAGNARVLRARFEDGAFYFRTDRERSLGDRVADLDKLVFHKELGHYGEKARRLVDVAAALVNTLASGLVERGVDVAKVGAEAGRAALLCKADLMTGVVNEFPELQGIMGRTYALKDGEPVDVAFAIDDQYAPRLQGAALPRSHVGAIVGVVDRVDTLVGILGIGKAPTGSADPFALRRAAVAILSIAIERGYAFSLDDVTSAAVDAYQRQGKLTKADKAKLVGEARAFLIGRLKGVLVDRAAAAGFVDVSDIVDAAMGAKAGVDDLPDVWARVLALATLRAKDTAAFAQAGALLKRVGNIVKKARDEGVAIGVALPDPATLELEAERDLCTAVERFVGPQADTGHGHTLAEAIALRPLVTRFFDDVMVMVDDATLRAARLALLGAIEGRLQNVADFTRLQAV